MEKKNKMGALALALMVFTSVYGFANIPLAFYKMSYSSIPYFIVGSILYFVPFSLMIAEMAQSFKSSQGGIYTWMEKSVNTKWAFTGIFMWWISYVVWMVGKSTTTWIPLSFVIFGKNMFTDTNIRSVIGISSSQLFGIIGIIYVIIASAIAIKGIKGVAKLASIGGFAVVALNLMLFVGGVIVLLTKGLSLGETNLDLFHSPNPNFLSPIAALGFLVYAIFAFGGMEASGGLIDDVKDEKSYVKGLFAAGIIVSIGYALGVFFVGTFTNWQHVMNATDANGEKLVNNATVTYVVVGQLGYTLGEILGIKNPEILRANFSRFAGLGMFCAYIGAFFTLIYAPLKQMVEGTPKKLWPAKIGEIDEKTGTPKRGIIVQGFIVVIMIGLITFGGDGALKFFETLQNMTNIAMTLPYLFISIAYIKYLKNDKIEKPFRVLSKNLKFGLLAGWIVTITVTFANIFSVVDLDKSDKGIMGINIPFVYDQYILGPIIFALISYVIVYRYEKLNKK